MLNQELHRPYMVQGDYRTTRLNADSSTPDLTAQIENCTSGTHHKVPTLVTNPAYLVSWNDPFQTRLTYTCNYIGLDPLSPSSVTFADSVAPDQP